MRYVYGFFFSLCCLLASPAWARQVHYVDAAASGQGTGSSWADAFTEVQDALAVALPGEEIWVAGGTYYPDGGAAQTPGDRTTTFHLQSGVAVYGGFGGQETHRHERNWKTNPTLLSGDLGTADQASDNAYHVVTASSVDATAVLDGFILISGNADGGDLDGIGGGLLNIDGSPTLMNMRFLGNTALRGGGLYNRDGHPLIVNAVFSGNRALDRGGALYNERSDAVLTNVTLSNNTAPTGAALYNDDSNPVLTNSIVWGNSTGGDPDARLECEREGYPCRLSEVDPVILERSDQLGDEVLRMLDGGQSLTDALSWIQAQEGVVEATEDGVTLRFRLGAGRPTWVFSDAAFRFEDNHAAPRPGGHKFNAGSNRPDTVQDVVGDDPKQKRALVLAPYLFQFGSSDSAPAVAALLSSARGYEGNVTYLANDAEASAFIGVDQFTGWGDYDVVFVSSHGTQQCNEIRCRTAVLTAMNVNLQDIPLNDPPGLVFAKVIEGRRTIALTNDFFAAQYPQGLSDAIIYIDACQTFKGPELAAAIAGPAGVYFGWSETVFAGFSKTAASTFFGRLIGEGVATGSALTHLQEQNLTTDGQTGAALQTQVSGDDLRIREIVWLHHPLTEAELPVDMAYPVIGQPGDGVPDRIPYLVQVDGVEGDPGSFIVHVEANGFSSEKALSNGEALSDNRWQVEGEVPVPFDAQPGQPLELRVWVELPEGGQSEWMENVTLGNPKMHFISEIETEGGDAATGIVRTYSKVEAEFDLALDEDLEVDDAEGTLMYREYIIEAPSGCTITTTMIDGTLRIVELDYSGEGVGVPNEVVLTPLNDISETYTITCSGGGGITLETIHWFAGFFSFHGGQLCGGENELDEDRGGLVITGWTAGSGEVVAQKVYDRTCTVDEVTFTEKTVIEILSDDQTTAAHAMRP